MIRCHNCKVLNCPQEEYPARLLPTPWPSYIANLQSRLIKVRKGIFPAFLKLILKINYPLPEQRPAPETSVQPDDVIGEHRTRENNPSSQCDPSQRRAASIRRRNPERRHGRPRSIRGQDPEYREPRRKWGRKKFSLSKPVWMGFFIQTAQSPASIRSQRNPERRHGRPRSIRGQDPEYREPRRKWGRKKSSLSKPVWMGFFIQTAQAPSRCVFCFDQTSV